MLTLFIRSLPLVIMTTVFALLYYTVPNRAMNRSHALAGGVFATAGFTLMQRLFSSFIVNFPAYTVLYGAFAAIPIFLAWLYLSWSVVLAGALGVAELPGVLAQRRPRASRS